ncbi:hypothetical protein WR25_06381 isoform B [Diploscapter pachys]|uniref:Uncharacterized protein n=1 Tax=Diploscapter pachys TaxID=2018661 RepID=A0A2A2M234_9BILA|nr:hypothetical protein WR25_06381 isoform B [Diploscapter pachys]
MSFKPRSLVSFAQDEGDDVEMEFQLKKDKKRAKELKRQQRLEEEATRERDRVKQEVRYFSFKIIDFLEDRPLFYLPISIFLEKWMAFRSCGDKSTKKLQLIFYSQKEDRELEFEIEAQRRESERHRKRTDIKKEKNEDYLEKYRDKTVKVIKTSDDESDPIIVEDPTHEKFPSSFSKLISYDFRKF